MYKSWNELHWKSCRESDEDQISQIETKLGITLPADYRECIKSCNGGIPIPNGIQVPEILGGFRTTIFLLSLTQNDPEYILGWPWATEGRPNHLIPFAADAGGDLVCFDFENANQDKEVKIVYWHTSGLPGNEFVTLARSFAEFLGLLQ